VEHPGTVTEAVQALQHLGYADDFRLDAAGITCGACATTHMPERLEVTHQFRFEGPTDPGDEAIVLGVRCPHCEGHGIVVSAYGPSAEPELFELLARLVR
jgi:hypothetical protein